MGEVVEEAILDHRADGHLRRGEQLFHRHRQQVRAGVAQYFQALGVAGGDDAQAGVAVQQVVTVHQLAVHSPGHGGLGQAAADAGGHLENGQRLVVLTARAIRQGDADHLRWSLVSGY